MKKSKNGFTLIEMVLVVSIIVILASVGVFAIGDSISRYKAGAAEIGDSRGDNFELGANAQIDDMLSVNLLNTHEHVTAPPSPSGGAPGGGGGGSTPTPTSGGGGGSTPTPPVNTATPTPGGGGGSTPIPGGGGYGGGATTGATATPAPTPNTSVASQSSNGISASGMGATVRSDGSIFMSNSSGGVIITRNGNQIIIYQTSSDGNNVYDTKTYGSVDDANAYLSSRGLNASISDLELDPNGGYAANPVGAQHLPGTVAEGNVSSANITQGSPSTWWNEDPTERVTVTAGASGTGKIFSVVIRLTGSNTSISQDPDSRYTVTNLGGGRYEIKYTSDSPYNPPVNEITFAYQSDRNTSGMTVESISYYNE